MEARIRNWPEINSEQPKLLGYAGFKVGCIQIVSIDDREKTPNHGKQLVSLGTVVATPPISIIGIRGYHDDNDGAHALFDVYSSDMPKEVSRLFTVKPKEGSLDKAEKLLNKISELFAVVAVFPNTAGLEQKKPYVFEVAVKGGDLKKQFDFLKNLFGKQVKVEEVFELGTTVDVASVTKGKGIEGPITRWGVKKKQHKSRKTVRAVGSLGPISPASIMYTVPRAGQRGFHQRVEYNKRIMIMSNTGKNEFKINPSGGFKHYGVVNGDFVVLKGSVPGTYRRLVKLRTQIRNIPSKVLKPNILEIVV
ncbi:MAG: ribosomal protein [Candidatus Nitrosotenuis sp.]|nr:ribosomal protein [Candidatus Nitrosotenuis sp.]